MRPRPDEQSLASAHVRVTRFCMQPGIVLNRALEKKIVPTGCVQSFDVHFPIVIRDSPTLPVSIASLVFHPVVKVWSEADRSWQSYQRIILDGQCCHPLVGS